MGRKLIDLTNKRFGMLTVIKRANDYIYPDGKQHQAQWLCKCDCGKEVIVMSAALIRGHTKSCGCTRKEVVKEVHKKYNTYDLSGKYGIGYTFKGEEFYFDLEDYEKIKDYCWYINQQGYVMAYDYNVKENGSHILMHRLIMCSPDEIEIDHINHNKHNNKKENLRIVNDSQNQMNKSKQKNNTSGVTGVRWHKKHQKWYAHIGVNRKQIHIGSFDTFEEAVAARKEAEERYFGEYSYNNSIGGEIV